ncbi:TauD/TfdA family dioxygenase [Hyphomonas sp. WL0036]|uniref:TauD/TfdA dioxygenase family protein n=1 Tax=Hyphomonas sediminis TaxID=2866160 RepID=UPI001C7F89BD|nr:TauD/TfdA family dioxygenase [Hyphomonas sediminis]MBY9066871.1 TauD/TfdA family dioxygenase [Hyphomonas sediminis]
MHLTVTPSDMSCGAMVRGADLSQPLTSAQAAEIRDIWLKHQVVCFPDQALSDDDLERFTLAFGPFGDDPFIAPIPGRKHIIAVKRAAGETSPIFAESWHSDWSFQATPPAGTCLYGITIPPEGGDTLFVNQIKALEQMPDDLRRRIEGRKAIHSAKNAYSPKGMYGAGDTGRSMDIRASDEAEASHAHPFIRVHPETGKESLFGCAGYIVGVEGMAQQEAWDLVTEVYRWQTRPEFQYRHTWQKGMLLMWDNRSTLHMATGGYAGHDRLLHRTTIGSA